jgi:hypothetical protein
LTVAGAVAGCAPEENTMGNLLLGVQCFLILAVGLGITFVPIPAGAQETLPDYLKDRGTGIPTSMFGTYVRKGELLVYPFFEYYHDGDLEYKPSELNFGLDQDFRGTYRAREALLFLAYGLNERVAFEFEAAVISATLWKSPQDTSAQPTKLTQSGLGDVAAELRFRWAHESERRPELFSYFETSFPVQKKKLLIATPDWEYKFGTGVTKGFSWGTITARGAFEYTNGFEPGEYAFEYLKRVSPQWRIYAGIEGTQDEVEFITEAQWHFSRRAFVKLNNAFGLTSKAVGWGPEVGIMLRLGGPD